MFHVLPTPPSARCWLPWERQAERQTDRQVFQIQIAIWQSTGSFCQGNMSDGSNPHLSGLLPYKGCETSPLTISRARIRTSERFFLTGGIERDFFLLFPPFQGIRQDLWLQTTMIFCCCYKMQVFRAGLLTPLLIFCSELSHSSSSIFFKKKRGLVCVERSFFTKREVGNWEKQRKFVSTCFIIPCFQIANRRPVLCARL